MLSDDTLRAILAFREEREWRQFHSPQNLAIALAVEAGELLEQFQWMVSGDVRPTAEARANVEQEVADLVILLSYLTHDLGIDMNRVVAEKLRINAARYPVERAKGSAKKYDAL